MGREGILYVYTGLSETNGKALRTSFLVEHSSLQETHAQYDNSITAQGLGFLPPQDFYFLSVMRMNLNQLAVVQATNESVIIFIE